MTQQTQIQTPPPALEESPSKPYAAPTLTDLGSVEAVTAGGLGGNLDMIVGSSSGLRQADGTS